MKCGSRLWLIPIVVPPVLCCAGLLLLLFDFSSENVLHESSLGKYTVRLVRHPRKDLLDKAYMTGEIAVDGRVISGPFWMGSLYSDALEFSEHRYLEEGILLVHDCDMPDSVLIAMDLKSSLIWPDDRKEDRGTAAGEELMKRVNRVYGTNFHIADFHAVKRWNCR